MQKSCFSKYKGNNGVSIAIRHPSNFKGPCYPDLFPKKDFFYKYLKDRKITPFIKSYNERVLSVLDPYIVWEQLKDYTILCWEVEGIFCHRNLVVFWLELHLNVAIPEYSQKKNNQITLFDL